VTVSAVDDLLSEGSEDVVVDIDAVTNGTEDGIQTATVTIADDEGSPTAASSSASVPATGAVDVATTIVITVRDASNNLIAGQAANLAVSITAGPNTGATFAAITDNANGTYTTSYTPAAAGVDSFAFTLSEGGTPTAIGGGPYSSTVS